MNLDLYVWGNNTQAQLGDPIQSHYFFPSHLLPGIELSSISLGNTHSAAITSRGTLLTWGDGVHGKLGHSTTETLPRAEPVRDLLGQGAVTRVDCGKHHTIAVVAHSLIFAWGANTQKQLGLNNPSMVTSPVKIPIHATWVRGIQASDDFSLVLTDSSVYYLGEPNHPDLREALNGPEQIHRHFAIRPVHDSQNPPPPPPSPSPSPSPPLPSCVPTLPHTQAHREAHTHLHSRGVPVPIGEGTAIYAVPLPSDQGVREVIAGTRGRCAAVTMEGNVYIWVRTGHTCRWRVLDSLCVVSLRMGTSHYLALTDTNDVFSWGRNAHSVLGLDPATLTHPSTPPPTSTHTTTPLSSILLSSTPQPQSPVESNALTVVEEPRRIESFRYVDVTQIRSGAFHCMAMSGAGSLYLWGRGAEAQLGTGSTHDQPTPTRIPLPQASVVDCGAFHSGALVKRVVLQKGKFIGRPPSAWEWHVNGLRLWFWLLPAIILAAVFFCSIFFSSVVPCIRTYTEFQPAVCTVLQSSLTSVPINQPVRWRPNLLVLYNDSSGASSPRVSPPTNLSIAFCADTGGWFSSHSAAVQFMNRTSFPCIYDPRFPSTVIAAPRLALIPLILSFALPALFLLPLAFVFMRAVCIAMRYKGNARRTWCEKHAEEGRNEGQDEEEMREMRAACRDEGSSPMAAFPASVPPPPPQPPPRLTSTPPPPPSSFPS